MITYQDNGLITYDEWLRFRGKTLGASEVGPVVIGSQYTSNLEIFWSKITGLKKTVNNLRTYIGRKSENIVDQMYPYFDKTDDSIFLNQHEGKILRKMRNINSTIYNSKFPHLSSTPDRVVEDFGVYSGKGEGCAEYKNTQGFILDKYGDGLPPDNVFQLCVQLYTGDYKYGDLFYFIDNRSCRLYTQDRSGFSSMWKQILSVTTPFWANVEQARIYYNQAYEARRTNNNRLALELDQEIIKLEPPAQNTNGYLTYLTQRYKDRMAGVSVKSGTNDQLLIAQKYKEYEKKIKKIEIQQREIEITLKMAMAEFNCLDFGKAGQVTWYPNKNGSRIFKVLK